MSSNGPRPGTGVRLPPDITGSRSFDIFARLHRDLRFQIWCQIMSEIESRLVSPQYAKNLSSKAYKGLLLACRESHNYFMAMSWFYHFQNAPGLPKFYYNYHKDTLYLNHNFPLITPLYKHHGEEKQHTPFLLNQLVYGIQDLYRGGVERIALYVQPGNIPTGPLSTLMYTDFWTTLSRLFPNLKELTFMLSTGLGDEKEDIERTKTFDPLRWAVPFFGSGTALFFPSEWTKVTYYLWYAVNDEWREGVTRGKVNRDLVVKFRRFLRVGEIRPVGDGINWDA